jgi:hypothetical protein
MANKINKKCPVIWDVIWILFDTLAKISKLTSCMIGMAYKTSGLGEGSCLRLRTRAQNWCPVWYVTWDQLGLRDWFFWDIDVLYGLWRHLGHRLLEYVSLLRHEIRARNWRPVRFGRSCGTSVLRRWISFEVWEKSTKLTSCVIWDVMWNIRSSEWISFEIWDKSTKLNDVLCDLGRCTGHQFWDMDLVWDKGTRAKRKRGVLPASFQHAHERGHTAA